MALTRIVLAGEGGQGVQSVAEILAEAAYNEGKQAIYIPNFGLEQRGGVSIAFLQISENRIGAPKFNEADIVVALSERAMARTHMYSGSNTTFVYDCSFQVGEADIPPQYQKVFCIPAVESSKELDTKVFNVIVMGVILALREVVSFDSAWSSLQDKLGYKFEKNPALKELNNKALYKGKELIEAQLEGGEQVCAGSK